MKPDFTVKHIDTAIDVLLVQLTVTYCDVLCYTMMCFLYVISQNTYSKNTYLCSVTFQT